MNASSDSGDRPVDEARRARLRRLAELTPSERLERQDALNRQLTRLREDARRTRSSR